MIAELNEVKKFFNDKFGEGNHVPCGIYAVPTQTSRGNAFMRVKVTNDGKLSHFDLWWDKELKTSWYDFNKDGTKRNKPYPFV